MSCRTGNLGLAICSAIILAQMLAPHPGRAHCDGLDGPVVTAARAALDADDIRLVLPWVRHNDEAEVQRVFAQVMAIRQKAPEAKQLADTYFLETVVRLHRVSEGAPYTGLKPAGRDLGPAIPAADRALETGDIEPVMQLITEAVTHGLREHYAQVRATQFYAQTHVQAGRAYVEAYVKYIHYVEGLYKAATQPVTGHYPELVVGKPHRD